MRIAARSLLCLAVLAALSFAGSARADDPGAGDDVLLDFSKEMRVSGITQEQIAEIKSAIQAQQKFLGELVEHSSGWVLEGAELRIYFSPDKRSFAEMIEGRESLEK